MKVFVLRKGSYDGPSECLGPVEVGQLPRSVAGQIDALVNRLDFAHLPDDLGGENDVASTDYSMRVWDDSYDHWVRWNDRSKNPARADLLEIVLLLEAAKFYWRFPEPGPPPL